MRALACALVFLASSSFSTTAAAAEQTVSVKGSDTIGGELGPQLAKGFEALHPGTQVQWEALGSKTAFTGLFDASADIGASSRPVNADELAQSGRLGIKLQEFIVAYDGLSIIVHPGNKVPSLTVEQLAELFAGTISNWKQLGGDDVPVVLIARPSYSGTRSFFEEKALHVGGVKRALAPGARILERNQEITSEVARLPGAISFVGVASVTPAVKVMALAPAAAAKAIKPEPNAIRDGSYPLYRPLFLYLRGAPSAAAADLVRFTLSPSGQDIVQAVGFVRLEKGMPAPALGALGEGGKEKAARPPTHIFFPWGGYKLSEDAKHSLAQLANSVRDSGERLILVGNADGNGGADSNRRTALARAKAVAGFLRAFGIVPDRMELKGAGADSPLGSNESRSGRERNRRVDVFIVPAGAADVARSH